MFLKVAKQGSTLAGIMDAFAISVSLGLQYGVPIQAFAEKFTNMRFEPAGMTDDPDLRIATSLVDYIFRRLAVDYLTKSELRGDLRLQLMSSCIRVSVELQAAPVGLAAESHPLQPHDDLGIASEPGDRLSPFFLRFVRGFVLSRSRLERRSTARGGG